jgi:hypothetical protein
MLMLRRIAGRVAAGVAALLVTLAGLGLAAGLALDHLDSEPAAGWARSSGDDALWMGCIWAQGAYTPAQFRLLTGRIRDSGISDVYVFVGQMDSDGYLDPGRYAGARSFLASFRSALPRVRVSAWISGVLGGGSGGTIALASGVLDAGVPHRGRP